MEGTGHLSHFAIGPTGTVKWRNEAAQPAPLPTPKARNGVTDEEKKTAKAVQDALKTERERTSGRGEATQVILGPVPGPKARHDDPPTSHEAAAALQDENIRRSQQEILDWLRSNGPMADFQIEELAERVGSHQSPSGLRTRRDELVTLGLVEDSGQFVLTPSNRRAMVWRALDGEIPETPELAPAGRVLRDFP